MKFLTIIKHTNCVRPAYYDSIASHSSEWARFYLVSTMFAFSTTNCSLRCRLMITSQYFASLQGKQQSSYFTATSRVWTIYKNFWSIPEVVNVCLESVTTSGSWNNFAPNRTSGMKNYQGRLRESQWQAGDSFSLSLSVLLTLQIYSLQ